ncbi:MAG: AmmeMemoRadiSam system protein B [Chloroflexi bacterium]|nr:MAG: AmmeMemoRadiSam system protein B [Chloroflexota bacterium]
MVKNLIAQFDEALLLESHNFHQTVQKAVGHFRAAPHRQPALAGLSYPAEPAALKNLLRDYLDSVDEVTPLAAESRGIISPHIDYPRGGPVYAGVWAAAAEAIQQAEFIIVLGTDHNGGLGTLTLTPQNYASPLGVMPTDQRVVNRLADVLGPDVAFADELHHRREHSIELVLIWLQYMRQGNPCPMLPVLTGSFYHFMTGHANIEDDRILVDFVNVLRDEMAQRRTVIVASGDLAHLGPAFDEAPLDAAAHAQMKTDDDALLENLCQGNAESFFNFMKAGQFRRNVCGLSPFYLTLQALGQTQGQVLSYDRCPADTTNTSFVSVCGLVWQ